MNRAYEPPDAETLVTAADGPDASADHVHWCFGSADGYCPR